MRVLLFAAYLAAVVAVDIPINGWILSLQPPKPMDMMTVNFYLKQRNLDLVDSKFWDISNPDSENYGKYLSDTEIRDLVGNENAEKAVKRWFTNRGIPSDYLQTHTQQDMLSLTLPVKLIEQLFSVVVGEYYHNQDKNTRTLRSIRPHTVPSQLVEHVELISGLYDFPPLPKTHVRTQQKLLERALAAKQEPAGNGTVYVLIPFANGPHQINISYTVHCLDEKPPMSATAPCEGQGGVLLGIQVRARELTKPNNAFEAFLAHDCAMMNKQVVCSAVARGFESYAPWVLELHNVFLVGSPGSNFNGPSVTTPPVVATPWHTTESVKALYNIPQDEAVTDLDCTASVGEFEQQYYSQADLELFFQLMGVENTQLNNVTIIGPNHAPYGDEASLDIQWLMGIAPGAPMTYWSVKAKTAAEIDNILEWGYQVMNVTKSKRPLVHSLSYGMTEVNVDRYLGKGYMARSEVQFKLMALSGLTILIADGDEGAYDLGGPPMSADSCDRPHADWPSNSPSVLSVSATFSTPYAEPICYNPEIGIDCSTQPMKEVAVGVDFGMMWTTGGGFSNFTSRAPYQDKAVEYYFTQQRNFSIYYNKMGRAYPDVSAVGHALTIVQNGQTVPADGTSAAAPVFAAVVVLLNNALMSNNKPPLGFANQLFYKIHDEYPAAFNDVVVGNNRCGAFEGGPNPLCCATGYEAVPGWDPITGLGTPNYPALKEAVLKMTK